MTQHTLHLYVFTAYGLEDSAMFTGPTRNSVSQQAAAWCRGAWGRFWREGFEVKVNTENEVTRWELSSRRR